ncbi:MAG TPA: hypothetical protein VFF50_11385 [Candidatus Deferrimicrobiaceae bacterium]|jgi:hypothetical protein|nr:hypothetical protein [Candidatus Deferrimicrobiaceae bacterium]
MDPKTRVWVLSGLIATLAAGVVLEIIHRKDDSPKKTAAAPIARSFAPVGGEKPSAGKKTAGVATSVAPTAVAPKRATVAPPAKKHSGPDEYAASPPAPREQTGARDGANATSGESVQTRTVPSREPLSAEVMIQNAQAALARGDLISPPEENALYWSRRARRINPQNQPAVAIEETILLGSIQLIEADRRAGRYDRALKRLSIMQTLYPDRPELARLLSAIQQEQSSRHQYVPH